MLLGNFLLPLLSKLSENRLHLSNSSELDCIRFALSLRQIKTVMFFVLVHLPLLFFLYLLLDYCWFVTFDNYLRKKRTNNYKNRRKLKVFCFLFDFFLLPL